MGRSKAVELDPHAQPDAPPEEAGGEGSESLFDASGDARVRILRRDDRTQKMVTHGYMEPTVSEEQVSARFGGGHYRAQLFVPDDSGVPKVKRSRDFDIPGPYKPPAKINTMDEVGPHAPVQQQNGGTALPLVVGGGDDLMQVLKAGIINTLLEMMKSTKEMSAPRTPAVDPMLVEIMKAQAATQSQMMQFMLTLATKDGGDSKKDMLDLMAKMKELVAPPASANGVVPADPMKMFNNMLETFKSFREAAEDVSPPSDGMGGILSAAPKLIEVISEQHQMQKNAAAAAASQPRAAQQPIVGTIAPQPQGPPPALWQRALREHAGRLVASAAAKHDPDVIAGTAILFAPPALLEAFKIFFHRSEEEVAADVFTEIPLLAEHREWVADFVVAAQERLFPEEFEGEDEPEAAAQ